MDLDAAVRQAAEHVSALKDEAFAPLDYKPISADSHVTEPPNCFTDYIDPQYRDRAPHIEVTPEGAERFVVPGMEMRINYGGISAAGLDARDIQEAAAFKDIHRGGWDGHARVADQERDGVGGEVIYPSVGMLLCNHPDADYKSACFTAYNRWLQEFQSAAPDRIFGVGQTAVRSVKDAIADLERTKDMGFRGAMLPCEPATDFDYDDPAFDPLWRAAVDLKLPLSFHILTSGRETSAPPRGISKGNRFHTIIRANQDVLCLFVWGAVFERFPELKVVCVEADAGWAPHFMYRMDHFYNRHRFRHKVAEMARPPSEYFRENIYLTFQDDFIAFNSAHMMNPRRLLWANDFPHGDSTWPWSQQILARQTQALSDQERRWILRDNVAELYDLPAE